MTSALSRATSTPLLYLPSLRRTREIFGAGTVPYYVFEQHVAYEGLDLIWRLLDVLVIQINHTVSLPDSVAELEK